MVGESQIGTIERNLGEIAEGKQHGLRNTPRPKTNADTKWIDTLQDIEMEVGIVGRAESAIIGQADMVILVRLIGQCRSRGKQWALKSVVVVNSRSAYKS